MTHPPEHPLDAVDRAIGAMRATPLPPGPSAELAGRTLHAMRSADLPHVRRGPAVLWRIAAVLIVGLSALAIVTVQLRARHTKVSSGVGPGPSRVDNHPAPTPPGPHFDPGRQPQSPPTTRDAPTVIVASDVSISGHVYFTGARPAPRQIDLAQCPACIGVTHGPLFDDSMVVNDQGGMQNVVVSVSAGLPPGEQYPAPVSPVMLDQVGCMFRPHVVAAMIGQSVIVRNSDPLLHSVHSTDADDSPAFNFAQPTVGQRELQPLQTVETFRVKCDLHPWMSAWIRTFNHPYFCVTGADGSFAIRNLPPGTYRIKAWHESLGVVEKEVRVPSAAPATLDLTFASR